MAKGVNYTEPHSYNLDIMTLINNEGVAVDIRDIFTECVINESITSPFLTGEINIADSIGLIDLLGMTGK